MPHEFQWKNEYSVKIKEIDDQHKQLIKLISDLYTAISDHLTHEKLGTILRELLKYAEYHFSTEEKYFKQFNYPDAEEHIEEHQKFADKMLGLQKSYSDNEIEISFELLDFLEDWIIDHLTNTDQKYIECFRENGLK